MNFPGPVGDVTKNRGAFGEEDVDCLHDASLSRKSEKLVPCLRTDIIDISTYESVAKTKYK
jgi:hypothetical protein